MLRRRIITLDITTDDGRPEDWDWETILNPHPEAFGGITTEVAVVSVVEEKVK